MPWVSIFDDTKWEPGPGPPWRAFGDNNWWETVDYNSGNLDVKTSETWATGYVPTKLRLTFTGAADDDITLNLLDVGLTLSWTGGVVDPVITGQELDLSYPGGDIDSMVMTQGGPPALIITNIEFFEAGGGRANQTALKNALIRRQR